MSNPDWQSGTEFSDVLALQPNLNIALGCEFGLERLQNPMPQKFFIGLPHNLVFMFLGPDVWLWAFLFSLCLLNKESSNREKRGKQKEKKMKKKERQ